MEIRIEKKSLLVERFLEYSSSGKWLVFKRRIVIVKKMDFISNGFQEGESVLVRNKVGGSKGMFVRQLGRVVKARD